MSDYEWFDSPPSAGEAPDECQMAGCDRLPTHYMSFKKPKEYLCYCPECLQQVREECKMARASAVISQTTR